MYKNKTFVAVIGARSGSKSIRHKNLSLINGKTLLYWIIKVALRSRYLDGVYVSTDSAYYQKISLRYGAACPVLRPKSISKDSSMEIDYILHLLKYFKSQKIKIPDFIVRLQATSPFQITSDIDNSIKLIAQNKKASSLQVVSESAQNPVKALKVYNKIYIKPYFFKNNNNVLNRQFLKKSYYRSNIIISNVKNIIKNKQQIGSKSLYYEIPSLRSIDINNKNELKIAKLINKEFNFLNEKNKS
jgi:CMP-N,N'-diacetyllegionaminic acid synthase